MAGYTRQDTANNIANGNVIDADDFDAEYNAVESAFNATSGHTHDGSAGEGAPITKVGPAQDLVVSGTQILPKVSNTLDLGSGAIQFKDGYFDGTVDTDDLTVSAAATVGTTLDVTGVLTATGGVVGDVTGDLTGDVTGTVSSIANHDTDDLVEGATNQYFTQGRARASISATGSIQYNYTTGVISYTQGNTDTISEGAVNLYYTAARADAAAKSAISVTDAGGDGSLTYTAGAITYTGPSATEVRAHFSAGTGVTYAAGQFSIGQPVGTSDNVTFNNAIVNGDLTVSGTTTTVNSNDVNIADSTLTLNSDESGAPSQDAGIVIERGTSSNVSFLWDESEDKWTTGGRALKTGTLEATGLTLGGTAVSATASELNTASTHYVPSGGIIMWSGAVSAIPTGWVLCNGSNSTPDLRNRFVVGAGSSYAVNATGGASTVALSTANLPAHTHSSGTLGGSTNSAGSHTHSGTTNTTGSHTHTQNMGRNDGPSSGSTNYSAYDVGVSTNGYQTDAAGNHSHTLNINSAGSHSHTVDVNSGSTGSAGSGSAHENRPPYYALAYIMKT